MQIKIYVDVLFLVNFIMDYLLLTFTALLLRKKQHWLRLTLSSLLGAMYATAVFFIPLPLLLSLGAKIAVSSAMVLIGFGCKRKCTFYKNLCVFYLVTFCGSGICFALFTFTGIGGQIGAVCSGGVWYVNIPTYRLIPVAIVLYLLLRTAFCVSKKAANKVACVYHIHIEFAEKELTLPALYDTGNFLTDSKGYGVLIAEWKSVAPLFSHISTPTEAAIAYPDKFTLLNCSGIGGSKTLFAFLAKIRFSNEKNSFSRLVAVTEQQFDPEKTYTLILPNDLEGAKQNDGKFIQRHFHTGKISLSIFEKPFLRNGKR